MKVGDRVIGKNYKTKGFKGTILEWHGGMYSIEFDENIGGHDAGGGKNGHCWNLWGDGFELIDEPKRNVEPTYEIY